MNFGFAPDDEGFWNHHPHLLVAVYRSCFDLLRSGCFTRGAAFEAVKRFYSGYTGGEVDEALAVLVRSADLVTVEVEDVAGCVVFLAGPRFPQVGLWPEAS